MALSEQLERDLAEAERAALASVRSVPRYPEVCIHTGPRTRVERTCTGGTAIVCIECGLEVF